MKMDKSKIKVELDINQNIFNIINDDEEFHTDIEIYGDNHLLFKILNDKIKSHKTRWHKPNQSLKIFNKICIILRELNKSIDPYGEENWDDILIEKNWKIVVNVKEDENQMIDK